MLNAAVYLVATYTPQGRVTVELNDDLGVEEAGTPSRVLRSEDFGRRFES